MTHDQLEYSISQYLDGHLPPGEANALEERFATDPEARVVLEEYQAVDRALRTTLPAAEVDWGHFAAQVCDAVRKQEPPVRSYFIGRWQRAAGLALAACMAIVLGISVVSVRTGPAVTDGGNERGQVVAVVVGPQPERSEEVRPVFEIAIGPAPTLSDTWRYAETVISRPAVVLIDQGSRPVHDIEVSPF
jgi:anti-sigma factor RsiW